MNEAIWLSSERPSAMMEFLRRMPENRIRQPSLVDPSSDRKWRLFAIANSTAAQMADPEGERDKEWESRNRMLRAGELFVDGLATEKDVLDARRGKGGREAGGRLDDAFSDAEGGCPEDHDPLPDRLAAVIMLRDIMGNPFRPVAVKVPCRRCGGKGTYTYPPAGDPDEGFPAIELHCSECLGNGWRWPAWRTPTVKELALAAYEERDAAFRLDPARLAVLSDALEEAGCDNEDILRHLRGERRCCQCPALWDASMEGEGCSICADGWVPHWWLAHPSPVPHAPPRGFWPLDAILGRD